MFDLHSCMYVCIYAFVYRSKYLSTWSVYLFSLNYLPAHLTITIPIYCPDYLSTNLLVLVQSICLSVCIFTYLSIYLHSGAKLKGQACLYHHCFILGFQQDYHNKWMQNGIDQTNIEHLIAISLSFWFFSRKLVFVAFPESLHHLKISTFSDPNFIAFQNLI